MAQPAPAAPNPDEERRHQQCAQRWIAELAISEKAQREWLERVKRITKLYKQHDSQNAKARKFAMLWANTETIKPAIYSRPPQPVVTRRFNDQDPIARVASEILERCLSYSIDVQDMDGALRQACLDYVLGARGQLWERYEPTFGDQVVPQIAVQVRSEGEDDSEYTDEAGTVYPADQVKDDGTGGFYVDGKPFNPLTYEESFSDYVNWQDFGHGVARTWDEVGYVWRRVYLSRKQLIKRFGELGKLIPLDWGPIEQGASDDGSRLQRKAAVYEIWEKAEKRVYWISKSWSSRPLDERDDPLRLPGFFPCPRPLLGTTANDSCIPVPDYVYYQDQAEEIDTLTARITELQSALKVRGFYAGDVKTNLNVLLNSPNNTLIPVPDWLTLKDGGGVAGKVEYWPIQLVVSALQACVEQRALLVQDVYQITGVADIMRGMNDPRATATAERIKGAWGTLRVRDRQVEMMRFARDQLRIKGAVIAGKFDPETLKAMSGVKLPMAAEKQQLQAQLAQQAQIAQAQMAAMPPGAVGHNGGPPMEPTEEQQAILRSPTWEDVVGLLRDNAHRQFRIDIETDSTIEPDEAEEKQAVVDLTTALGSFIAQWGPAVAAQPELAPVAGALIKHAVRRFRAGRELEDVIETAVDKIAAKGPQPAPGAAQQPPDNSLQVAQVKGQADIQREQIKQQGEDGRAALEAQTAAGDQALKAEETRVKLALVPRDPEPQITA